MDVAPLNLWLVLVAMLYFLVVHRGKTLASIKHGVLRLERYGVILMHHWLNAHSEKPRKIT